MLNLADRISSPTKVTPDYLSAIYNSGNSTGEFKMKEIRLTQEKVALVDDEDFEYLNQWNWYTLKSTGRSGNVYYTAATWSKGKNIRMHSLLMDTPEDLMVDHKDHDELNNQKENLRICNGSQNQWNSKPNTGKRYKGTSFRPHSGRFQARIMCNGKSQSLGHFSTEEEAALAYNAGAILLFGEFAYLNDVTGIDNKVFTEHILNCRKEA